MRFIIFVSFLFRFTVAFSQFDHSLGGSEEFLREEKSEGNKYRTELQVGFDQGPVVINEIMYDPIAGQPEWIELYNRGDLAIDLRGWTFSDADTTRKIFITNSQSATPIFEYAVLSEDSFLIYTHPILKDILFVPQRFPRLNDDSDIVFLFDSSGKIIDRMEYDKDWGGGNGISIECINPMIFIGDSSNWGPCVFMDGSTPGQQNSIFMSTIPPGVTLSVFPNPFSPDNDGFEDVTEISYHLPMKIAYVNLQIYDVHGRRIRTLMGASMSGSQGSIFWDGCDDGGRKAYIGIYIVYIEGLDSMAGKVSAAKTTVVLGGKL